MNDDDGKGLLSDLLLQVPMLKPEIRQVYIDEDGFQAGLQYGRGNGRAGIGGDETSFFGLKADRAFMMSHRAALPEET
jgi:hypothetical protein